MENNTGNTPVISFGGTNASPGADAEAWGRYNKWVTEVYYPLVNMKSPFILGIDRYQIIKESPEYASNAAVLHFPDLKSRQNFSGSQEIQAILDEYASWVRRHVIDYVFANTYELLKSFRNGEATVNNKIGTMIGDAPVMLVEGYQLSPEEQGKYSRWLVDNGFRIFLPLFMQIPGLKGYDFYRDSGYRLPVTVRDYECPQCLSFIHFEDTESLERYRKGPELTAFQKAIRNVFPSGLNLRWYISYRLVQSWRK
jgi:hypothetical protein